MSFGLTALSAFWGKALQGRTKKVIHEIYSILGSPALIAVVAGGILSLGSERLAG